MLSRARSDWDERSCVGLAEWIGGLSSPSSAFHRPPKAGMQEQGGLPSNVVPVEVFGTASSSMAVATARFPGPAEIKLARHELDCSRWSAVRRTGRVQRAWTTSSFHETVACCSPSRTCHCGWGVEAVWHATDTTGHRLVAMLVEWLPAIERGTSLGSGRPGSHRTSFKLPTPSNMAEFLGRSERFVICTIGQERSNRV